MKQIINHYTALQRQKAVSAYFARKQVGYRFLPLQGSIVVIRGIRVKSIARTEHGAKGLQYGLHSTYTTLINFCVNHGNQRVFFNLKSY